MSNPTDPQRAAEASAIRRMGPWARPLIEHARAQGRPWFDAAGDCTDYHPESQRLVHFLETLNFRPIVRPLWQAAQALLHAQRYITLAEHSVVSPSDTLREAQMLSQDALKRIVEAARAAGCNPGPDYPQDYWWPKADPLGPDDITDTDDPLDDPLPPAPHRPFPMN